MVSFCLLFRPTAPLTTVISDIFHAEVALLVNPASFGRIGVLTDALASLRARWVHCVEAGISGSFVLRNSVVPLPSPAADAQWYRVTVSSGLCVRQGPSQFDAVVGGLPEGAVFQAGAFSAHLSLHIAT
jgi:hypothetical protein